ncbi:MAG: hypothetical protein JXQ81_01235 [Desulfuromonadales bacterium]|nr:hypothetical protein [Desulfuromonadales bacterium]MBN2791109.1 hypothetical protein [Desulfuromonadales bacterium]
MKLDLTQAETQVLAENLDASLSRLQDEIAHTDDHDVRESLKQRRMILQMIKDKLS